MKTTNLPDSATVCDLLMHLEPPHQLIGWIMSETAARMEDIQQLRVGDVRHETRTLMFRHLRTPVPVPLSLGLAAALQEHQDRLRPWFESERRRAQPANPECDRVTRFGELRLFPARMAREKAHVSLNEPVATACFIRALRAAAQAAGFTGPVQSNTLRHACALRWLEQGMDVHDLHHRLGHRDLMTTLLLVQALNYGGLTFLSGVSAAKPSPSLLDGHDKAA
jgi:integrase